MTPQVADIFNDRSSKNTAFNITLKDIQATDAYDFNKLYASILRCCDDNFGWAQFMPVDEVQPFDGNITTGIYFVVTDNCVPLHGNGWYADAVVCDALELNIITHDDIKHQLKASNMLQQRFFGTFLSMRLIISSTDTNLLITVSSKFLPKTTLPMTSTISHKTVEQLCNNG